MAFSPDGKILVSGSMDRSIILWNVAKLQPIGQPFIGHTDGVSSLSFSPDGKTMASGSLDKAIILWNVSTMLDKDVAKWQLFGKSLTEHADDVSSLAFSPDGKTLAAGSGNGTLILWDITKHQPIGHALTGHTSSVSSLAFNPDGKTLASCSDDIIILWNVVSRQLVTKLLPEYYPKFDTCNVAFSADGNTLAIANNHGSIILWNLTTRQIKKALSGISFHALTFSPDGKTVASTNWTGIYLWDIMAQKPIGNPFYNNLQPINSLAFSPDGKTLASGSYEEVIGSLSLKGKFILWDVATLQPIGEPFTGHNSWINSLAFSPDGKTLASGSKDSTIILWNVSTHQPIGQPFAGHTGNVTNVAFSPDGKTLASGGFDGTIILWDLDPQSLIEKACQRVGRNFTRTEWKQYGFTEPYRATCPQWPLDPEPTPIP